METREVSTVVVSAYCLESFAGAAQTVGTPVDPGVQGGCDIVSLSGPVAAMGMPPKERAPEISGGSPRAFS